MTVCGIVAVLGTPRGLEPPPPEILLQSLAEAVAALPEAGRTADEWEASLERSADALRSLDGVLRSAGGVRLLVADVDLCRQLRAQLDEATMRCVALERGLDEAPKEMATASLEGTNAALIRTRDLLWALSEDRVGHAARVRELASGDLRAGVVEGLSSLEAVMSALDRLEVRGRDSAGVHVLIEGGDAEAANLAAGREKTPLFVSGSVRRPDDSHLSLVYKAAAEIGELGDNGRRLRSAAADDRLLRAGLGTGTLDGVLGHTRWASVGLISEANAHPLNNEEGLVRTHRQGPYVVAALNGDVDNYQKLVAAEGIELPAEITTDAKVIPVLVSRRLAEGLSLEEAFRRTVASFEGSVAIAAQSTAESGNMLLALRGSGQALYVGLTDGAFIVASEPYGVVEQASHYLRVDGETPGNPRNPNASRGQIVVLDREKAGTLEGIRRLAYDGTELPVDEVELHAAEITTRDIDRGEFSHFLLKELHQAPRSFSKTLRGKIRSGEAGVAIHLGAASLPADVVAGMRDGRLRQVFVIGQGTAAVAGRAIAKALEDALPEERFRIESMLATELSGFHLRSDMSDSLVLVISQSGTTTDTNRTVDLVRARGARVVAIVNRRGSDLVDRADGVLYTSDGRDVEMSVASTKAFYSQIAAGFLLALALRQEVLEGGLDAEDVGLVEGLLALPGIMIEILGRRDVIGRVAARHGPRRRYWAVVGNGWNRIAAEEIRIKLSELCYKAIACDGTEDKKHIDLSSEPMILVCAPGLTQSTLSDVSKEVAIYNAHKAAPVVVTTEGSGVFDGADDVIEVPACHPHLAFVLATMVGHLFAYEAALAIDSLAVPLRRVRGHIETLVGELEAGQDPLERLGPRIAQPADVFSTGLASGEYDGQLEASTAVRLATLLAYARRLLPLESFAAQGEGAATPARVVEELMTALTDGIDELTRPIDAIKHQAKTVTVGISRADEGLFVLPLVQAVLAAGTPQAQITYRDLRALAGLDASVAEVLGHTRYRIELGAGREARQSGSIGVVGTGGIGEQLSSRTDDNPQLLGTKHLVANERILTVARGRSDGRTVILIPEVDGTAVPGLLLLHVRFHDHVPGEVMRAILESYRNRYTALRDAVTETEPVFRDDVLGVMSVADLLTDPVYDLASRWESAEEKLLDEGVVES
ncbi:MAG: SIS domain-containing protein [Acidobacteriota bacterium]|nr:SIS domain-containing protein [Acidobacteriota bacterium]